MAATPPLRRALGREHVGTRGGGRPYGLPSSAVLAKQGRGSLPRKQAHAQSANRWRARQSACYQCVWRAAWHRFSLLKTLPVPLSSFAIPFGRADWSRVLLLRANPWTGSLRPISVVGRAVAVALPIHGGNPGSRPGPCPLYDRARLKQDAMVTAPLVRPLCLAEPMSARYQAPVRLRSAAVGVACASMSGRYSFSHLFVRSEPLVTHSLNVSRVRVPSIGHGRQLVAQLVEQLTARSGVRFLSFASSWCRSTHPSKERASHGVRKARLVEGNAAV